MSHAPADTISYLFVDGGCVRAELNGLSMRYRARPDVARLNWSAIANEYTKIFYYDALPLRLEGEDDASYEARNATMLELHEELRKVDRFHVYEGDVRRARGRKERPQQKKVDVMIAVDMLLHTFRRNMERATLLASDLDFAPLVHALVREGMFVTLWYPPVATTPELQAAADSRIEFTAKRLAGRLIDDKSRSFLPSWENGRLQYRQHPVLYHYQTEQSAVTAQASGIINREYVLEVFDNQGPRAWSAHHDLRTLMLTAEEKYSMTFDDAAFATVGGRPGA